jgi:CheY-like chemotaxis protein
VECIPFRFDSLFENLSALASARLREDSVEFLFDLDPAIPERLEGDPYRIGQVLSNLVSNAVKFTEQGSVVVGATLQECADEQVWLRFEVRDTGIGIEADKLKNLFEPFIQADGSTTRRFGGTGLGLAISQQLCSLMGGSIEAESEPGSGSVFSFTLPLKPLASGRLSIPSPDLRGLKVLLVDDSPLALELISDMLVSMTFQVITATSGAEALNRMQEAPRSFDLVLMDWRMPEMDGVETAHRIVDVYGERRPLIILMTAYGREMFQTEFNKQNLDGFLVKPLTPSMLFDAIIHAHESREGGVAEPVQEQLPVEALQGTVLLVEDNEINQQVAKELLEQMGLQVETVGDGQQAVEYLEHHCPDLVLMDIQMPVMDGYEATRLIRKKPPCAKMPIYAMSANALVGDAEKSMAAGMDGHINKPVDPDELYRVLSGHLPTSGVSLAESPEGKVVSSWRSPEQSPVCIDFNRGVAQVGGNADFYLKLLRDFVKKHGDSVTELKALLSESRWEEAHREAHTLKGVAGNIGAKKLQQCSKALEASLLEQRMPPDEDLEAFVEAHEELFATLRDTIRAVDVETTEPADAAQPLTEEDIEKLLGELSAGKASSEALYRELRAGLLHRVGTQACEQVDALLHEYEFEAAAELIQEALEQA